MRRVRWMSGIASMIILIFVLLFQPAHLYSETGGFTFIAVGDVMLTRGVGKQIRKNGPVFPFQPTAKTLREADLTFANLETQISTLWETNAKQGGTLSGNTAIGPGLIHAGIDVVSLANNHSMDFGADALFETMDILAHHGIASVGAGMNETSARRSANFVRGGVKISVLAYSWNFYITVEAAVDKPGVAVVQRDKTPEKLEVAAIQHRKMTQEIKRAKTWADVVIVSFHWGWEYTDHPTETDRKTARLAVDAGANLVVGHHPHVIQGVERYRGQLICYSLGNFVFDQWRTRTRQGLMLRCHFDGNGKISSAELLPIIIDPQEFRPRIASGDVAKPILKAVQQLSARMKTEVRLHPKGSRIVLH